MSIEMQKAFESDMAVFHSNDKVEYVDNDEHTIHTEEKLAQKVEVKEVKQEQVQEETKEQVNIFEGDF